MVGDDLLDGLEGFGLAVLDDVSLVQHAVVPLDAAEEVDVLAHDVVRGHDEVVEVHVRAKPLPLGRRAHVLEGLEVLGRYEFVHFENPVTCKEMTFSG